MLTFAQLCYCCIIPKLQVPLHVWWKLHLVILKQKRSLHEMKNAVYYFHIFLFVPEIFKVLKYANMMEKIYLSQFVSEMFDSVQYSTKCALQFQLTSFVTMATYWVPDLPNINSNSGHLWCSIFIFANGASSPWSNKHLNMLAWVCGLVKRFSSWKSLTYWNQVGGHWKRVSFHGKKCFIAVGMFSVELLAYQVSMVCAPNWPR